VSLEAFLIAVLAWIAAMTLAGAGQSDSLIGSADAAKDPAIVSIRPAALGKGAIVTTKGAPDHGWVHVTCTRADVVVFSEWAPVDAQGKARVRIGPTSTWTSGPADCGTEIGWFAPNGRWRVDAVTTFGATG